MIKKSGSEKLDKILEEIKLIASSFLWGPIGTVLAGEEAIGDLRSLINDVKKEKGDIKMYLKFLGEDFVVGASSLVGTYMEYLGIRSLLNGECLNPLTYVSLVMMVYQAVMSTILLSDSDEYEMR